MACTTTLKARASSTAGLKMNSRKAFMAEVQYGFLSVHLRFLQFFTFLLFLFWLGNVQYI
jgi:hypothetical protein